MLAIYFCRVNRVDEVVLGLPVLNRGGKKYKQTLGMYAQLIPCKISIAGKTRVSELLQQIARDIRSAYRHARYPLSLLARHLNMVHEGRDRLFDVVLSYEIQDFNVCFGQSPLNRVRQAFGSTSRYPLSVSVCEFHEDDPVEIAVESSDAYLNAQEAEQLGRRIKDLAMAMIASEDADIFALPLVTDPESHELISARHADVPQHPAPQPYIKLFEHQAALRPSALAIKWASGRMNYGKLNARANRLARHLQSMGVEHGQVVAVLTPRQPQTLVAYLAISKLGAAFTPMDPDSPWQRIDALLQMSDARAVVVGETTHHLTDQLTVPWVDISGEQAPQKNRDIRAYNLDVPVKADDLAYLLFTSGSTGTPKGVLMNHAPLTRRLAWLARTFNFTSADVWLQSIQLTFDPALIEWFLPLTHGGCVALAPPGPVPPGELAFHAESLGATAMIFVPTTLRYFNHSAPHHPNLKLRLAISGGELLHRDLAAEFVRHTGARIYNLYGPTEACIFATAYLFDPKHSPDPVPIGKPVDDTRIYVLDHNLRPLPAGAVGEIFIGGDGLAQGYLNNPQANLRFVDDPFVPGARLYYSGDHGYWDEQDQLQFVGRQDDQIKLRGQRMEPAEIESAMLELPWVEAAAVKVLEQQLHAWLVLHTPTPAHQWQHTLREHLYQKLPSAMVPGYFTLIEDMPRQSSGKTDYSQLAPDPVSHDQHAGQNLDHKPYSSLERLLLGLWQDALGTDTMDIDSDFFSLGGNSIIALALLAKIEAQTGQAVSLALLLRNPTVRQLAGAIVERHHPIAVNLSRHQAGSPVYLAASGHGDALRMLPLANALDEHCHLQMLQPPLPGGPQSTMDIPALAEYYANHIEHQPHHTPPLLAGFSIGGIAALETARLLIARQVPIAGLVLIDTTYPSKLVQRPLLWRIGGWLVNKLRLQEMRLNQRTLGSLFNDPGLNTQIAAMHGYKAQPLSIPVTLLISTGFMRWYRPLFKPWYKVFGEALQERHLPGFHGTLFDAEHVAALADAIKDAQRQEIE